MPFEDPTPRSFVVPRLLRQCMAGFKAPAAVTVEDAGAEPRHELRIAPKSELEAELRLIPLGDGRPLSLSLTWESLGARGQHCFQMVVHGAQDRPDMEEDHPIHGVIGVGKNGALTVSTDALDDTSYLVERDLFQRIALLEPLLPTQPVGVGARWHHRQEGRWHNELIEVDMRYELLKHDGSHVVLALTRIFERPEQTVAGRKAGQTRRLDALREETHAILDLDLRSRPIPAARVFDADGRETERIMTAYR